MNESSARSFNISHVYFIFSMPTRESIERRKALKNKTSQKETIVNIVSYNITVIIVLSVSNRIMIRDLGLQTDQFDRQRQTI